MLLELKNITKVFKLEQSQFCALSKVNLQVNHSESVAISGPSGSGKTTLLNIAGLIDNPDSGTVILKGIPANQMSEQKQTQLRRDLLGHVFQRFHLIPVLSVMENTVLPALLQGKSQKECQERAYSLLKKVGMHDFALRPVKLLSGGQRQRVAIARALMNDPDLILADEPTANLDRKSGDQVIELLFNIPKETGKAVLIVTHDPQISARADRRISIIDGKVEENHVLAH